jgi:SSS family transporter
VANNRGEASVDYTLAAALVAYLIVQFGIAFFASRFIKVEADYFVAGRRLGVFAVGMSVFATWFGAEAVVGSSGAVAEQGLSGGSADPFGYTLCLLAMATFLAYKMREAGVMTFVDFFRQRFGPTANTIAAALSIPTSLFWASAQLLALGYIISEVTTLDLTMSLAIATMVIVVYTTVGGLLGDVITDIVQGSVLIIGLIVLLIAVLVSNNFSLANISPEQLSFIALNDDGEPLSLLATLNTWMVPIVGSLVAQEAISRFLGATSPSVARKGCYLAAGLYLVIGSIPVIIGLLGAAAGFVTEGEADQFLPQLAQQYLDPVLYVIVMGALVSAILSTVDTTLLAISAVATRNLVEPVAPNLSEPGKVRVGRAITALTGVLAFIVAATGESIQGLVEIASSFGSAGIAVALLIGLHSKMGDERAAVAALVTGAVMSFFGDGVVAWSYGLFAGEEAAAGLPWYFQEFEGGYVFAVIAALVAYVSVAWFTRPRPQVATA